MKRTCPRCDARMDRTDAAACSACHADLGNCEDCNSRLTIVAVDKRGARKVHCLKCSPAPPSPKAAAPRRSKCYDCARPFTPALPDDDFCGRCRPVADLRREAEEVADDLTSDPGLSFDSKEKATMTTKKEVPTIRCATCASRGRERTAELARALEGARGEFACIEGHLSVAFIGDLHIADHRRLVAAEARRNVR